MTRVVVAGAGGPSGAAVMAALRSRGYEAIGVGHGTELEVDLSDAAAVQRLASEVGAVDGVIHLVGGWRAGRDDDDWHWLLQRNVETVRNTTRAFAPALLASPAGRFAIVSSTAVDAPGWSAANYAAAKAAAEAWVQALAASFRTAGTAAAVIFLARSLGDSGTPYGVLGERMAALWDQPAADVNGQRIPLPSN